MNSRSQRKILIMNLAIAAVVISVTMFAFDAGGEYNEVGDGIGEYTSFEVGLGDFA